MRDLSEPASARAVPAALPGEARSISVVIPAYRSAATLPPLLERLCAVLGRIADDYEIICVDDCSPDNTWDVLLALKRQYGDRLRIVRLLVNGGQHNAILCGFSLVRGDIVITMDDDLQNPPEEIPKLVAGLSTSYDLVIGSYDAKKHSRIRNVNGGIIDALQRRMFNLPNDFQLTSFRAIRREVIDHVLAMGGLYPYITAMLLSNTNRRRNVPVEHRERGSGRSGYTLARSIALASNLLLSYSSYPVYLVAAVCLIATLLFAASIVVVLYLFFTGEVSVPGWASVVVLMSLFHTLTLLCLVVVAIYLARLQRQFSRAQTSYRIGQIL